MGIALWRQRFRWDRNKGLATFDDRDLVFEAARIVFRGPLLRRPDSRRRRTRETRFIVLGELYGRVIAIIYTPRGGKCRIISLRPETALNPRSTMSTRPDKPKKYFAKLISTREEDIDYSEIPPTARADWQDAEVLLPVTAEEFQAIREFLRDRRRRA